MNFMYGFDNDHILVSQSSRESNHGSQRESSRRLFPDCGLPSAYGPLRLVVVNGKLMPIAAVTASNVRLPCLNAQISFPFLIFILHTTPSQWL
jgi:hypothetical protein